MAVVPDGRKTLHELRGEWSDCEACDLGKRRKSVGGKFVFGTGARRSMMFIGEGPGVEEEKLGSPFVGKSGQLLRTIISSLKLSEEEYYLSNLVTCRSCSPRLDAQGIPMQRTNFKTKETEFLFQDEPPLPTYIEQCRPRLYEEIYLVDPIVIVGLGATACEALLKKPITITREHGNAKQISIPGAVHRPALTPGGKWARKIHGVLETPTEQNEVYYFFIPTLHPAFILHKGIQDRDPRSFFNQLYADIAKAVHTYDAYLELIMGRPTARGAPTEDEVWEQYVATLKQENT